MYVNTFRWNYCDYLFWRVMAFFADLGCKHRGMGENTGGLSGIGGCGLIDRTTGLTGFTGF